MIDRQTVFEIHRMAREGVSQNKISKNLKINKKTVKKYLKTPDPQRVHIKRESKLDPFKDEIADLLRRDSSISSSVVFQRISKLGYIGKTTILKDYLVKVRSNHKNKEAFIRFESPPGKQIQIDWGHFGTVDYDGVKRNLYCLGVVESHSRMLYLEFTHSQKQEVLHRALLNAFVFFEGAPDETVHDNMLTAVIERKGPLIRYNGAFLDFLRPFESVPRACNVRKPHEKGKVEKGAIHLIRYNFWPLRVFKDLKDLQSQADEWRDEIANKRIHSTTGERPIDRFRPESMNPLPYTLPDCRETENVKVRPDFCIRFDGNTYTVPPWAIGKKVVAKADYQTVSIYYKEKAIASHVRSWKRKRRIEIKRHEDEAKESKTAFWKTEDASILMSMGEEAKVYLEKIAQSSEPLGKTVRKLLELKDDYGTFSLLEAIKRANSYKAYGASYIENILYQEMTPKRDHLPVLLKEESLNKIRLEEPSLKEFDVFILEKKLK